jgi:hypothetical protein
LSSYKAVPNPLSKGDKEWAETINVEVLVAKLIIGALEALVARDAQRVAALLVQAFLLLSKVSRRAASWTSKHGG